MYVYIYVYNYVKFVRGNIERVFCCCFEHTTQAAVQLVAVVEVGKLGEEETSYKAIATKWMKDGQSLSRSM